MDSIVIFGHGALAELAQFYFARDTRWRVAAFATHAVAPGDGPLCGLPVLPFEEVVQEFPPHHAHMFVATDRTADSAARERAYIHAATAGYTLASHVCPSADVAEGLSLAPNTLIMERAGIQPFVRIGPDTVIGAGSRIGFRTTIGAHCWIDGALFGESVRVGDHVSVGVNTTISPFVKLGSRCSIGPGTLITEDIPPGVHIAAPGSKPSRVPSHRLRHI